MIDPKTREVISFFITAKAGEYVPVAVPIGDSLFVAKSSVTTMEGTFLAKSSNPRARALAAVMLMSDARHQGSNQMQGFP